MADDRMQDSYFAFKSLLGVGGLIVWAAHFTLLYASNAIICARRLGSSHLAGYPILLTLVTLFTLLALALITAVFVVAIRRLERGTDEGQRFLRRLAAMVALLAAVAVLFNAAPAYIVPTCT